MKSMLEIYQLSTVQTLATEDDVSPLFSSSYTEETHGPPITVEIQHSVIFYHTL